MITLLRRKRGWRAADSVALLLRRLLLLLAILSLADMRVRFRPYFGTIEARGIDSAAAPRAKPPPTALSVVARVLKVFYAMLEILFFFSHFSHMFFQIKYQISSWFKNKSHFFILFCSKIFVKAMWKCFWSLIWKIILNNIDRYYISRDRHVDWSISNYISITLVIECRVSSS